MIPQRITLATVTGLAAALVLTACGGSNSDNAQNASAGRAAPRAVSNGLGQGGDAAAAAEDGYGSSAADGYGSGAASADGYGSSDAAAGAKAGFVTTAVKVQRNQLFGRILVDSKKWTMYKFDKDEPGTSNCYGDCAEKWPAILVKDAPALGAGVDRRLIGTYVRKNGEVGLTVNKWPMYRFAADAGPNQTKGDGVGGVWHVVAANGKNAVKCVPGMASTANKWLQTEDTSIGRVLTDGRGRTVYRFDMDKKGKPSRCDAACQKKWPRFMWPGSKPKVRGLDQALVGKVQNADGTWQTTYAGWALYYFAGDSKARDVNGQGVGDVWWAIQPNGQRVQAARGSAGGYSSGGGY